MKESALEIYATTKLAIDYEDEIESLQASISTHLNIFRNISIGLRSASECFITIIGDVGSWSPLKAAVMAYSATMGTAAAGATISLGKKAVGATWQALSALPRKKEMEPLVDFVAAIKETGRRIPEDFTLMVGLNIPGNFFSTTLSISPKKHSPEEVAYLMSEFLNRVEEIEKILQSEIKDGHLDISSHVKMEVKEEGGLLLKWADMYEKYERHIP